MSEYEVKARKRGKTLLIVEGVHEKDSLYWLIFRCFPEIKIDINDVWVYGTNIYNLYRDIELEYDQGWAEAGVDIDLPFLISKRQHAGNVCYKNDFKNIILVFDYEHQDPRFSEEKILEMQEYFVDAADMGKLYINYPMIESYQHLQTLPDDDYAQRKAAVALLKKYKALARSESIIAECIQFPHWINQLLKERYRISDGQMRKKCCEMILGISDENNLEDKIHKILLGVIEGSSQITAKYQFKDKISKIGYARSRQNYWIYMREIFKQIIYHNICKANLIQNGQYQMEKKRYKQCFEQLDLTKILQVQNACSRKADTGFIWVLNTCIFFAAEYNFMLVME